MEKREYPDEKGASSPKISQLKSYIAALLMLVPSMNIQSWNIEKSQKAEYPTAYQSLVESNEAVEMSDKDLFKNASAKAFFSINSLKEIPEGGIVLSYEQTPQGTYPKTINIYPKEILADELPYTVIQLGEKMYVVSPDMWFKVEEMYIDATTFYVVVTMNTIFGDVSKTTSKNKEDELWEYLWRLWSEGEDGRYLGSTVKEVPKNLQKAFLEEFNKLNV